MLYDILSLFYQMKTTCMTIYDNECPTFWERAIILVDMNAFFASVEQFDNPCWRGRPVAITNGQQGTCIITCSYEARAYGVKTGMRLKEARTKCPELIQCPARPERYAAISSNIMSALQDVTPDVEVFSIDEAFLDVSKCQKLLGTPEEIATLVKQTVFNASGLLCSVGISGDKTTAKYAAKQNKPNGLTVVPPWQAEDYLKHVPVTDICGIAKGIGRFLNERNVFVCGDMARLPIGELARRFGNPGKRIWYMCQGADPVQVETQVSEPKSIGHGKVIPPNTTDKNIILTYLLHMSEKVGARLRRHNLKAQYFSISLRNNSEWIGEKVKSVLPTQDGQLIYKLSVLTLEQHWNGEGLHQVQITATNPHSVNGQLELFSEAISTSNQSNTVMDNINQKYGEFCLAPARLLQRSTMPNVISPAWKPFGHRQTIDNTHAENNSNSAESSSPISSNSILSSETV